MDMSENDNLVMIEKKDKANRMIAGFLRYTLLIFWAIVVLFPFYWMIITSFKSYSSYNSEFVPRLIVASPTLQNYVSAFTEVPLGRYLFNTLIFTVITREI